MLVAKSPKRVCRRDRSPLILFCWKRDRNPSRPLPTTRTVKNEEFGCGGAQFAATHPLAAHAKEAARARNGARLINFRGEKLVLLHLPREFLATRLCSICQINNANKTCDEFPPALCAAIAACKKQLRHGAQHSANSILYQACQANLCKCLEKLKCLCLYLYRILITFHFKINTVSILQYF